jgi:hypothetical protein
MIAEGTYRGKANARYVSYGESNGGTPQMSVTIDLTSIGQVVQWRGNFASDEATRITCESLIAMGWSGDGDPLDPASLTGLGSIEVDVTIGHETYEGKTNARVKSVRRAGSGGFKREMTAASKATVADRTSAWRRSAGRPAATTQQAQAGQTQRSAPTQSSYTSESPWTGEGVDPSGDDPLPF